MKKYTIELEAPDIVKLIAACNSAIVSEEETLRNLSGASRKIIDNTKVSLERFWELKTKLKNAVINTD